MGSDTEDAIAAAGGWTPKGTKTSSARSPKKAPAAARASRDSNGDNDESDAHVDDDDETEVALRIGDFLTLRNVPKSVRASGGFLGAEGVLDDNVVVHSKPQRIDECVFQICIQNQYSALNEYVENMQFLAELQNAAQALKPAGHAQPDAESDFAKLNKLIDSLERSMENEKRLNATYMEQSVGKPVKFGMVIQLLHVKSNKYLTVEPNQVADQERENLRICLSEYGSSLSWFTVLPWFKVDREGDACTSASAVLLRVTERGSEQVHCSEHALRHGHKGDLNCREVNSSLERTGWRVVLYSQFHGERDAELYCGDVVRLVEPELNAYLRLAPSQHTAGRLDCVLASCEADDSAGRDRQDSSSLWVIEGHFRPSMGGPVQFGDTRTYRLRHLNTGKYLKMKTYDLWKKAGRLTLALAGVNSVPSNPPTPKAAARPKTPTSVPKRPDYFFCAADGGSAPSCALFVRAIHGNVARKRNVVSSASVPVLVGAAVHIECQGRWMHSLATGAGEELLVVAGASRNGTISLVVERYATSTQVSLTSEILVGVAAMPSLRLFKAAVDAEVWRFDRIQALEFDFVTSLDQLANFLLKKPLAEDPHYEELDPINPNARDEAVETRQMLLHEQGILALLVALLVRLEKLASDEYLASTLGAATTAAHAGATSVRRKQATEAPPQTATAAEDYASPEPATRGSFATLLSKADLRGSFSRRKAVPSKRRKSALTMPGQKRKKTADTEPRKLANKVEELLTLQHTVASRAFWVLLLASHSNTAIQMHLADHLAMFIAYVPIEPTALAIVTHMLQRNEQLQETKVTDSVVQYIVRMIGESKMEATYLDLLKALCACKGRGVDGNQCMIVEHWLRSAEALQVRILPQGSTGKVAEWSHGKGPFKLPQDKAAAAKIRGAALLDKPMPKLFASWKTRHRGLDPEALTFGAPSVDLAVLFTAGEELAMTYPPSFVDRCATVAAYVVAQIYLAAELCLDRNYLAIGVIRLQFPFDVCLAAVMDPRLPDALKAAFVRLITTVYVDTDPQIKSVAPHLAHNWSELNANADALVDRRPDEQKHSFLLLQDVLAQFLERDCAGDDFKEVMMELLLHLVQFSFYSTAEKMRWLVQPLVGDLLADTKPTSLEHEPNESTMRQKLVTRHKTKMYRQISAAQVVPMDGDDDGPPSPESQAAPRFDGSAAAWHALLHRPLSWQARLYDIMDDTPMICVVLIVVIAMLCLMPFAEDVTILNINAQHGKHANLASFVLTLALITEVTLRWYCYVHRKGYFLYFLYNKDNWPFNLVDALLCASDSITILGLLSRVPGIQGAKIVRVFKLVRIARAAKALVKLSERDVEEDLPDWIRPARYAATAPAHISTMLQVVTVLGEVALAHRDCNLAALLSAFKRASLDRRELGEDGAVALFVGGVAAAPRLSALAAPILGGAGLAAGEAGHLFDEVFLDLCLYDHEGLVQAALNLLMVQHSVRRSLLLDVSTTGLLTRPEEEKQCLMCRAQLRELQSFAERYELWGALKSSEDRATNDRVKQLLRDLTDDIKQPRKLGACGAPYEPVAARQTLLANLGALDVAIAVLALEASMVAGTPPKLRANTLDLLELCCAFLMWFVRGHARNQVATYVHLDAIIDCFEHDIGAPLVLAEVVRCNADLTKSFPLRIVAECAHRIFSHGRNVAYLGLLEALLFLPDHHEENNVELQFTVLKELTRPARASVVLFLCADHEGDDYEERAALMRGPPRDDAASQKLARTPLMDLRVEAAELCYQAKLLHVLAGCALGHDNITTVEAKLQNLYPPQEILHALLDPETTLFIKVALASFFYHSVVEVEIAVPDLEKDPRVWRFFRTFGGVFAKCSEPGVQRALCADTVEGARARQHLQYAVTCAHIMAEFLGRYLPMQSLIRDLEATPALAMEFAPHHRAPAVDLVAPLFGAKMRRASSDEDVSRFGAPFSAKGTSRSLLSPHLDDEKDDASEPLISSDSPHRESATHDGSTALAPLAPPPPGVSWLDHIFDGQSTALETLCGAAAGVVDAHSVDVFEACAAKLRGLLHLGPRPGRPSRQSSARSSFGDGDDIMDNSRRGRPNRHDVRRHSDGGAPAMAAAVAARGLRRAESYRVPSYRASAMTPGGPVRDPALAFDAFVEHLQNAPGMARFIDEDSKRIVATFERIASAYDNSSTDELRVEPLMRKLVGHTLARLQSSSFGRKLDAECTKSTRWLVQIFREMIEDKWGMSIDKRDEEGDEAQDIAAYPVQRMLNACGVTELCLRLIAPGVDRDLTIEAIRLCVALLFREGGNRVVQEEMHRCLTLDSELFFRAVRNFVVEIKNSYLYGETRLCPDEGEDPLVPDMIIVMRFLQLMSEGHFEPNQNIVREQPRTNINLLDDFVDLLSVLSRDKIRCRSSTKAALQTAATVLEVIQGPCKQNQMHLAIHTELIEILNRITRSKPIRDCVADEEDEVKKTALEIYEGLLEGEQGGSVIITRIISVIDLDVLKAIIEQEEPPADGGKPAAEPALSEIQTESLVLLQMFFDYKPALRNQVQLSARVQKLLGKKVTSTEVVWNGKVLRRFFPVPAICEHIAEVTRLTLVREVDRVSDESRLQDFMRRADDIYRGIKHQAVLQELKLGPLNVAQIFSRANQEYATGFAFFLALCINGVLLAYARHDSSDVQSFSTSGAEHIFYGSEYKIVVKMVLKVLNILNITLSTYTLILMAVVRCPVIYSTLHDSGRSKYYSLLLTMTDGLTLYYLFYTIVAGLAYNYKVCSSFLLLDIVVKSPTSADVLNAVIYPRKQLAATLLLAFFVVYIFSIILFQSYSDQLSYDDHDDDTVFPEDCRSLRRCLVVTLMYGFRLSGGIGDIFSHTWDTRLFIDFAYFMIVLLVLMNVIFGIIIDTFGELRSKKQERLKNTLENCFVCGLEGTTFDRAAAEPGGFRRHQERDHSIWDYLNFIIFIWEQDKDDDDGLELYVRQLVAAVDVAWLPIGKALCLSVDAVEEDSVTDQIESLKNRVEALMEAHQGKAMASLGRSVEHIRAILEAAEKKSEKRLEKLEASVDKKLGGVSREDRAAARDAGRDARVAPLPDAKIYATPVPVEAPPREPDRATPMLLERLLSSGDSVSSVSLPPTLHRAEAAAAADAAERHLSMQVLAAADLVDAHLLGSGDPYIFVRALARGKAFGESERIWMSPMPAWPATKANCLRLARPPEGESVLVEVWHCHRHGRGYFLGQAELAWADAIAKEYHTLPLHRKPGAKAQTNVQGSLHVTVKLTTPKK